MNDKRTTVESCKDTDGKKETEVIPGEGVKVWVGIDVCGNIAEVRPGEEAKCFDIIEEEATVDLLRRLSKSSGRKNVSVNSVNYLSLSSSPECWFWFAGKKYWIC